MYARSNCSVAPAAAETDGSFSGIPVAFMESWPGQEKRAQMVQTAPLAEATRELVLKARQRFELAAKRTQQEQALMASQPIGPRRISENRREPVKSPRLETAPVV